MFQVWAPRSRLEHAVWGHFAPVDAFQLSNFHHISLDFLSFFSLCTCLKHSRAEADDAKRVKLDPASQSILQSVLSACQLCGQELEPIERLI